MNAYERIELINGWELDDSYMYTDTGRMYRPTDLVRDRRLSESMTAARVVRSIPMVLPSASNIAIAKRFMDKARAELETEFERQSYDYLP